MTANFRGGIQDPMPRGILNGNQAKKALQENSGEWIGIQVWSGVDGSQRVDGSQVVDGSGGVKGLKDCLKVFSQERRVISVVGTVAGDVYRN